MSSPQILIIGAGSMGLVTGYHLDLAGADVTFLVRPHRLESLSKPQTLYCYNDNTLKTFEMYNVITDSAKIDEGSYDYILITLDGANLRNEIGTRLVWAIGDAARNTDTRVILGSVAFDMRAWLLGVTGLAEEQATNGYLNIHAYSPQAVTLRVHPPVSSELVAQADLAYIDNLGQGFSVDDSAAFATDFAQLYNKSVISRCTVQPDTASTLRVFSLFPIFAASELLGWPKLKDISDGGQAWTLAVAVVREIQSLGSFGEIGQHLAVATTEESLAAQLAEWEEVMLPLDLQDFNKFHHGGKVNAQDRALLVDCIAAGEGEGKPMVALRELVKKREEYAAQRRM